MNEITITGTVTGDPEPGLTSDGQAFVRFRIAVVDGRLLAAPGRGPGVTTTYWDCIAWRSLAVRVVHHVVRGDRVTVTGAMRITVCDIRQRRRTRWDLRASDVAVSLRAHPTGQALAG